MLNYFAKKPKSESKSMSLKRRMIALVVALVVTSGVYGLFLYSTHDALFAPPKPSLGISMEDKQVMWDYVTMNIGTLSPEKPRTEKGRFKIDHIRYQDADTALVQYNDGEMYYEAEATFTFMHDSNTQELVPDITSFVLVRDDIKPLE